MKPSDVLARAISIIGHPFVTVAVMMLGAASTRAGLTFLLIALVPVAIVMIVQVRRGAWEHADASNRSERRGLYLIGLAALAVALVYLYLRDPRSPLTRGVAISLATMIVLAIVSRWVKVSLHLTFAALAALNLILLGEPRGWVVAALVPPLMWSRLHLRRHTPLEVWLGFVAGVVTALAIHFG
jgi:hypothetical protein